MNPRILESAHPRIPDPGSRPRSGIRIRSKTAELHIYGTGGHGFGLRAANKRPVGQWIARFEEWLADSGVLTR